MTPITTAQQVLAERYSMGGSPVLISSPIILTLSMAGITSDATNGLEYGVTAPSGTGQEAAIQAAINNAVTTAAAAGVAGVRVIWDVAVALGGEIYLSSNTTIEAPHYGCGAIMRAGANRPIFRVQGSQLDMGGGAYTGSGATNTQNSFGKFDPAYSSATNPQWHRVFDPGYVNADNISILGGTWNGNSPQQATRPFGQGGTPAVYATDNIGWPCIMDFRGVNGIVVSKVRAFLGLQFGLYFVNCSNVILDEPDVDQVNDQNYDNDAIHFNGPCRHIRIYSPRVHCSDDCIAINADDANFSSSGLVSGVCWACSGDITDVRVHDAIIWEGRQNAVSWGAVCFRSTVAVIDDVVIDGLSGTTANWAIWAPQFGGGMLIPGPGNIRAVTLKDITLDLQSPNGAPSPISWGLSTENLTIEGRYRRNPQDSAADIFISPGITVTQLSVLDYDAYASATSTNNSDAAVFVTGTVGSMLMTGRSLRDSALSASAAPLVQVGYYTPQGGQASAFPNSGSGAIGMAMVDADAEGVTNVVSVNTAAASVGTLILRGIHRLAGGGSPLANAGVVGNYFNSALAYASASVASYTGTAPAQINAYTDPATGPAHFLSFSNTSGGSAYTPPTTANDTSTGYLDIEAWVNLVSYVPTAGLMCLVNRYAQAASPTNSAYAFGLNSDGQPSMFLWDTAGNNTYVNVSGTVPSLNPSTATGIYLRGIVNKSASAVTSALTVGGSAYIAPAGSFAAFSFTDGNTWTQMGTTVTGLPTTGIAYNGTNGANPSIGVYDTSSANTAPLGKVYSVTVRDTTKVLFNPNFTTLASGTTSFSDTAPAVNTYSLYDATIA